LEAKDRDISSTKLAGCRHGYINGDTINWTSNYKFDQTSEVVDYINKICGEDGLEIICTGAFHSYAKPLAVSMEGSNVSCFKPKKNRT
jgi:hypothetical protein